MADGELTLKLDERRRWTSSASPIPCREKPGCRVEGVAALQNRIASLSGTPDRGRRVDPEMRELRVRFGRDGYVVRYRVRAEEVLILRIFHSRELR